MDISFVSHWYSAAVGPSIVLSLGLSFIVESHFNLSKFRVALGVGLRRGRGASTRKVNSHGPTVTFAYGRKGEV